MKLINNNLLKDRYFLLLLLVNLLFSIFFFWGFKFTWGPDGTGYFLSTYQLIEPEVYGHMSTYFKPLLLLFLRSFQLITPDEYLGIKIAQHFLGFILPFLIYFALKPIKQWIAFGVAILTALDLNARFYFATFCVEPLFIAFMILLACSAAYLISFQEKRIGIIMMAIALCGAVLTKTIAIYLFVPLVLFLLLIRRKKAAIIILILYVSLQLFTNGFNQNLDLKKASKNLFVFQTSLYMQLINEETGPYTRQLINEIVNRYYQDRLSEEELAYFWKDVKESGAYSRGVIYAVAFEEALPEIDDLFVKSTIEVVRSHPIIFSLKVIKMTVLFHTFRPISMTYRGYMDQEWTGTNDNDKIKQIQTRRYDLKSNAGLWYGEIANIINKQAKEQYKKNMWSPFFEWPFRDEEKFMYYDRGNQFILEISKTLNIIFIVIINILLGLLPVSLFIFRKSIFKSIFQHKQILWLIVFSVLIILYYTLITIPVGTNERYRAPIDVFYFIILVSIYGMVILELINRRR
jgi:hypothetical protein